MLVKPFFFLRSADHSKHGKDHKHKHSSSEQQTTTTAEATTEQAVTVAIAKRYNKFNPFFTVDTKMGYSSLYYLLRLLFFINTK